jgi:DNA helicase II / ATP-dependent DNA helicase PcrA
MTLVCRDLDLDPQALPPRVQRTRCPTSRTSSSTTRPSARAENHQERTLAEAYADYQRAARANAFDFDDLIMTTVALLQLFPDVAEHYHRRFRHVLVDEYQDTNHAQYVLVRELVGRGDDGVPPRSCASWATPTSRSTPSAARRSATSRSSSATTPTPPSLLEQNYRSTQTILSAANAVITRNTAVAKRLWTDAGDGAQIVGYVADDEHDEATFVARRSTGSATSTASRGDVAVFYRTNAQSRCSRRSSSGSACPTRSSAGCASTSARRSATRSPTCGRWPTPTTTSRSAGSSTCPSAGSVIVPRPASRRSPQRERISFGPGAGTAPTRRPALATRRLARSAAS